MIVLVPPVIPDTMPVELPIVAASVLLLVHVPPGTPFARLLVLPAQSEVPPVIGMVGFTVTVVVVKQPPDVV